MKISKVKTRQAAEEICADSAKFAVFAKSNEKFLMKILSKINDRQNYDHQDLRQESLIALYSALQTYNPEQRTLEGKKSSSFSTYAYVLIKNEIVHYINEQNKISTGENSIEHMTQKVEERQNNSNEKEHRNTWVMPSLISSSESFEDEVIEKVDEQLIMTKLTKTERMIFQKKMVENLTHDQVAEALGMPSATYMTIYYKSFVPKLKMLGYAIIDSAFKQRAKNKD